VSKYENKFAKLQKKAAEFNFRNQLKTVKKKEFTMDEDEAGVSHNKKIKKIKIYMYVINVSAYLFIASAIATELKKDTHTDRKNNIQYTSRNLNTIKSRMLRKIKVFLPVKTTCFLKLTRKLARMS
jgi:hypothetical protein